MIVDFIRIPSSELESEFNRVLKKNGFPSESAKSCARVFMSNSVDGVYSHGVNRFPKFVGVIKAGLIKPSSQAICKHKAGAIEQWDGQGGPGPVNALQCTGRAMELAKEFGMGCVAVANTNHWMRGGTYGWEAAKKGFVFIGWSNTIANTPAWGAVNPKLGNNPLVIAVPHEREAIVLDMAMSQFSYGAMEMYHLKNERLPVPGGYDSAGLLSHDPEAIKKSQRTLPIGYWKGSGLSLLLDILGTILSGGLSVSQITRLPAEINLSQVFIAIDITKLENFKSIALVINGIIADYHASLPEKENRKVRYPGEQVIATRRENLTNGVPVSKKIWEAIKEL